MRKVKYGLILGCFLWAVQLHAQVAKSPFTQAGIGDTYDLSMAHQQGMGGVGISNGSFWYINSLNPALLVNTPRTLFAFGTVGEQRRIRNGQLTESSGGMNLNYVSVAFPMVRGKWGTTLGIAPFSVVNYQFSYSSTVNKTNIPLDVTESGTGGYSQFYWGHGIRINKNLLFGLKASYLFSSKVNEISNIVQDESITTAFMPTISQRTTVSDVLLTGSLAFKKDSIFNSKLRLNFGLVYDLKTSVNSRLFETIETRRFNGVTINTDTVTTEAKGTIELPSRIGVGISVTDGQKWTAGVDFKVQDWTGYRNFRGNNENLQRQLLFNVGGEFTPDPGSVTSYFKRISYRAGFAYEQTPYGVNGKQVNDFGINFGLTLPVRGFSSVDFAGKFGTRGSIADHTLKENYFKLYIGITFSDQWFIRRKYN